MQRILLSGSHQVKKTILIFEPKDSRTSSQPGAQQLHPEWWKVAGPVSASHMNGMPDVPGKFHLLCIPGLGCQSAVTRPHISRARTSAVLAHHGAVTRLLMRLGSSLPIIFVSLLHSENILAQGNKETWAMMVHRQEFPPGPGHMTSH